MCISGDVVQSRCMLSSCGSHGHGFSSSCLCALPRRAFAAFAPLRLKPPPLPGAAPRQSRSTAGPLLAFRRRWFWYVACGYASSRGTSRTLRAANRNVLLVFVGRFSELPGAFGVFHESPQIVSILLHCCQAEARIPASVAPNNTRSPNQSERKVLHVYALMFMAHVYTPYRVALCRAVYLSRL